MTNDTREGIGGLQRFCPQGLTWNERAQRPGFAAVLDPSDTLGRKNKYIHLLHGLALRQVLCLRSEHTVLDFGCGTGRLRVYAPEVGHIVGVDISFEMLRAGMLQGQPPNAVWIQGDGTCLPFAHEAFDYVVSIWVLQYFLSSEDLTHAVREIARTLKDGGRAILIEQISYRGYGQRRRPEEYLKAFADAGCRNVVEYSIRMGRYLTLYLIRYGFIPERLLMSLARREMVRRQYKGPPRWGYGDHLFVFEKGIRSQWQRELGCS